MIKTTIFILLSGVFFILFLAVILFTGVYRDVELPIEVVGALLAAIITVFITSLLIKGQAQSDELKERNVKVFEKKTEKFNNFIEKLWEVWKDRKIEYDELDDLVKIVCQDILMFTKQKTSETILDNLKEISTFVPRGDLNIDERKKVRTAIFNIIDLLAKEMNLGGEISKKEQEKLDEILRDFENLKKSEEEKKNDR